jgi:Rab-like protein 2
MANKIDLDISVTERHFSFIEKMDIPLFFVSASTGVNVVRGFNESIKLAIQHKQNPTDEALDTLLTLIKTDAVYS